VVRLSAEERVCEFEVAYAYGVEFEAGGAFVVTNGVEVFEVFVLGGSQVVQKSACCGGCESMSAKSEAVERLSAEVVLQKGDGVVGGEDPVFERRLCSDAGEEIGGFVFDGLGILMKSGWVAA